MFVITVPDGCLSGSSDAARAIVSRGGHLTFWRLSSADWLSRICYCGWFGKPPKPIFTPDTSITIAAH
jgi:hypothetical protein